MKKNNNNLSLLQLKQQEFHLLLQHNMLQSTLSKVIQLQEEAWNLGIAICAYESMIKYMGKYITFAQCMPNKPSGKSGTTVGTPK